jgi:hypothetical protein
MTQSAPIGASVGALNPCAALGPSFWTSRSYRHKEKVTLRLGRSDSALKPFADNYR